MNVSKKIKLIWINIIYYFGYRYQYCQVYQVCVYLNGHTVFRRESMYICKYVVTYVCAHKSLNITKAHYYVTN